jgi:hypothetical protein
VNQRNDQDERERESERERGVESGRASISRIGESLQLAFAELRLRAHPRIVCLRVRDGGDGL